MKLTADTITVEQIRRLQDVLRDTRANNRLLAIALHGPTQRDADRGWSRKKARARLAEIWNERAYGKSTDDITDEQIRTLFNIATLSPAAFRAHYPAPDGVTDSSWRLAVVTDCSLALDITERSRVLSSEGHEQLRRQARKRCAAIINQRGEP
jgi:hypothetical protein